MEGGEVPGYPDLVTEIEVSRTENHLIYKLANMTLRSF